MEYTREDVYKFTALRLARQHKKECTGEDCNISLYMLMEMAQKAGVKFTDKEMEFFY